MSFFYFFIHVFNQRWNWEKKNDKKKRKIVEMFEIGESATKDKVLIN